MTTPDLTRGDSEEQIKAALESLEPVARAKVTNNRGKKLVSSLFPTSPADVVEYVVTDIVVPALKDLVSDMVTGAIENALYGSNSRRGGYSRRGSMSSGWTSRTDYSAISKPKGRVEIVSPRSTDWKDLRYDSRSAAENVLAGMDRHIQRYGRATVGDLMTLSGVSSSVIDERWFWSDLNGAGVRSSRGGYIITLPDPEDDK